MALSILHRITGVGLALGLLAFCTWLMAIAGGEQSYDMVMRVIASPPGLLVLLGWTFSFFYHLMSGVRHLFWDSGRGFERAQRVASGWFVVGGSMVLTLCVGWVLWRGAHS